jgi:hypothetical protein
MKYRGRSIRLEDPILLLAGLIVASSVAFIPLTEGPILADLPLIGIPLGVSIGIALYSVLLLQEEYEVEQIRHIALFGLVGAIVAAASIWELSQGVQISLFTTMLLDDALTAVSIGNGAGVLLGAQAIPKRHSEKQSDRDRILTETVWTNESGPNPILTTITTQIAELEDVDPLALEPLYEHVNPDVFAKLRAQDNSQWQLLFYTDNYEIRVSSQGTVTIYGADYPTKETDIVFTPEGL